MILKNCIGLFFLLTTDQYHVFVEVFLIRFASVRNVRCYIDVCLNWTSFNESDRPGFAGNQNKFCSASFPELKFSVGNKLMLVAFV